jgi:hypothetical protein
LSYVNLPESLQKIFDDLDDRLIKLENAQRFTIPVVPVTVTAAVGNGTTITYTANNVFAVGQAVTIAGLGIASGSELNFSIAIVASATYTQFTVTSTVVGVSSGLGQAVIYAPTINGLNENDPQYPRPGDMWINSQSNVLKFLDGFGSSRSVLAPYLAINTTQGTTATTSISPFSNQFLEANKVYEIEALIGFSTTYSSATTHSVSVLPSFTGSINYYVAESVSNANVVGIYGASSFAVATSMTATIAESTNKTGVFKLWGIISTSASGQYGLSLRTDAGTNLTQLAYTAGSYLKLTPVASSRTTNSGSTTPGTLTPQNVY